MAPTTTTASLFLHCVCLFHLTGATRGLGLGRSLLFLFESQDLVLVLPAYVGLGPGRIFSEEVVGEGGN